MNVLRINKERAISNLRFFQSFGKKVTVMVKANAYGHGVCEIAKVLQDEDVKLGVATVEEAMLLSKVWKKEIIIVEPATDLSQMENFQFTIDDVDSLKRVQELGLNENCFLKINVGMNRFGINCKNAIFTKKALKNAKKSKIKGVLTHFPSLKFDETTKKQYKNFIKLKKHLNDFSVSFGGSEVCKYDFQYDEIRVGIGFYGYGNENVKPIASLHSQLLKVFDLEKGDALGYDGDFVAQRNMKVGVVGIGYGDGIDRRLTGKFVKINNKECKIIGKVCMDCLFVDLTDCNAKAGDDVLIFDDAQIFANTLNTIPYEILTRCSSLRGKRVVVAK